MILPNAPSKSLMAKNPHLWPAVAQADKREAIPQSSGTVNPTLNKTETRFRDILKSRGYTIIFEQAFTLRLGSPFKSYRPDLATMDNGKLTFWEVKASHRFARAGIAKAACASKSYPAFTFMLAMWKDGKWTESKLSS